MTNSDLPCILALDVGGRRIGVALARADIGLASPHTTLINDDQIWDNLRQLIQAEQVGQLVVGLPRGLDGQETAQTATVRDFAAQLQKEINLPFEWQDEAVTSVQAESELRQKGTRYNKEAVDAQAAAIILQDYLDNHKELRG